MKPILTTGLAICLVGSSIHVAGQERNRDERVSLQGPDKANADQANNPIEVKTDRFSSSNETKVTLKPQTLVDKPEPQITIRIEAKLEQKRADDLFKDFIEAYAYVESYSKDSVDFGDGQIRFLVNRRPLSDPPGEIELNPLVNPKPEFRLYESGVKIFDRGDLEQLVKASRVEVRIGSIELTLSPETVSTLRAYAKEVLAQHKIVNGRQ